MTSQARIDANRRNARKSTGPKSKAGKNAARFNSLWHGAFASHILLPGEDARAYARLRKGFFKNYHPSSDTECFLVSRLLLAAWRLQRLAAMENRVLLAHADLRGGNLEILRSLRALRAKDDDPDSDDPPSPPEDALAKAMIRDAGNCNATIKLARYQAFLERSFYRALHELERLRAPKSA